jgi:hypothetical protein
MATNDQKADDLAIQESQDGSAVVELPENLLIEGDSGESQPPDNQRAEGGQASDEDDDHPDDSDSLRDAKRSRRRAKKDLIRKTNQEKDVRLQALARENEEFKRRLAHLERNTKEQSLVRIDKGIEDAQVRLEYAKMKMMEATSNNDGQAMVEAQTLWQSAQEDVRKLQTTRSQAEREMKAPPAQDFLPDPEVQRNAAEWMRRNKWYRPDASDTDSKVAKKIDELMVTQGWEPSDPDYWDELDSRLQKELPHRYNGSNDDNPVVRKPRNVVGSSGREASAAYGGTNRNQFVLSPERVKAMKEAGAWDNPERKRRMIEHFIKYDRQSGR